MPAEQIARVEVNLPPKMMRWLEHRHTRERPGEARFEEARVEALVASFVDDVLVNHRPEKIGDYVGEGYIQHNPQVPDGIGALRGFMEGPGAEMVYRDVFKIIGQGNFVMVCSQVFLGQELAVFDLFGVEYGKIVEHWDNMEPMPEGPQPNGGKF